MPLVIESPESWLRNQQRNLHLVTTLKRHCQGEHKSKRSYESGSELRMPA